MITLSYSNKQLCRQNQLTRAAIRCHHYLVGSRSQRSVKPMQFAALGDDDSRLLLPPTKIVDESDAEHFSGIIAQLLSDRPEPSDFQAEVSGIFEELMINAIQHSPSNRPHSGNSESEQRRNRSYAMLEYSECRSNGLFSICVRDTGSGIRSSLRNSNKELSNAANAIKYATERGTTGTQEDRGIGLSHVKAVTAAHGGCLFITSGPSITTTVPQFAQFLVGNRSAGGKATRLASTWAGSHGDVLKILLLRTVVVILVVERH